MKFFIVGKHCAGKLECLNLVEEMGVRVGREFSNLPELVPNVYIDKDYEKYSSDDVERLFEQNSFIYMHGVEESGILDGYSLYRGLSHYTYDNADVMVVPPQALSCINKKIINDHLVFVWMDAARDHRIHRYVEEDRKYSFVEIEKNESRYDLDFMKNICSLKNYSLLYFNNEDPGRVATIIAAIHKHPDLLPLFADNYN